MPLLFTWKRGFSFLGISSIVALFLAAEAFNSSFGASLTARFRMILRLTISVLFSIVPNISLHFQFWFLWYCVLVC